MIGFHWPELLLIVIAALVIFGPKRLPEVGGALGRGIRDFRKGVHDLEEQTGFDEVRQIGREVRDIGKKEMAGLDPTRRAAVNGTAAAPSAAAERDE